MTSPESRAALFHAPGQPFTIERVPLPRPEGAEVLAQIRLATICGSDLHSFYGRRSVPAPAVLGHEMVATVAAIGPAGADDYRGGKLEIGDRITWSMVWSCAACFYCARGQHAHCEKLMKFGHQKFTRGGELTGGLADYCLLPEGTVIFRVPESLPDSVAAPANCATATVASVFRRVEPGVAVIFGAGMLGLTACAMARTRGTGPVIAIEPDDARRAAALRFGADAVFESVEASRMELRQASQGRGADVAIELSGSPEAAEQALTLLRLGGSLIMAGATFPARPLAISAEQIVKRSIRIAGVYNYSPADLETALAFLAGACGHFPFEELVGPRFELAAVNEAFECAERARPLRVAVIPNTEETKP